MSKLFWPILGAAIGSFLGLFLAPLVLSDQESFEVKRLYVFDTRPGLCPLVDYDVRLAEETHAAIEYTLFREGASGELIWWDSGSLTRDLYDPRRLPRPLNLQVFTANEILCPTMPGTYLLQVKYQLDRLSRWAPLPQPIHVITEPFVVGPISAPVD